jgi:cbb3-type cytochrome oxidase maturation protein
MDILYLLIPLSVVAMFGVLGIFAWALHAGQFDDLEREGARALFDPDQPSAVASTEESPPCH